MQAAASSDEVPHVPLTESIRSLTVAKFDDAHPATYRSTDLFQGDREIWIEHRGDLYRLRITSTGKLYLTK